MNTVGTLQYLDCPNCGPQTLFNGLGCVSCRGPRPAPVVTRPSIDTAALYGQPRHVATARQARAAERERAKAHRRVGGRVSGAGRRSSLTFQQIAEVFRRAGDGESFAAIGRSLNLSGQCIGQIVRRARKRQWEGA